MISLFPGTMLNYRLRNNNLIMEHLRYIHDFFSTETPTVPDLGQFFEKYKLKPIPVVLRHRDHGKPVTTASLKGSFIGTWIENQMGPIPCWTHAATSVHEGFKLCNLERFANGELSASDYPDSLCCLRKSLQGVFAFLHSNAECPCPPQAPGLIMRCCPFEGLQYIWEAIKREVDAVISVEGPFVKFRSTLRFDDDPSDDDSA